MDAWGLNWGLNTGSLDAWDLDLIPVIKNEGIEANRIAQVQVLLERGANPNKVGDHGHFPLQIAATSNQLEIVELLLARPNIKVNQADNDGFTALGWAAYKGHVKIVELLLAHPTIEVNKVGKHGHTALTLALLHEKDNIVKLLVDHYIDKKRAFTDKELANPKVTKRICEKMGKSGGLLTTGIIKKRMSNVHKDLAPIIGQNVLDKSERIHTNDSQKCIDWYNKYRNENSSSGHKKQKIDTTRDDRMELSDNEDALSKGGYRKLNGMNKKHKPHLVKKSNGAKKTRTSKKTHRMKKSNGAKKTQTRKTSIRKTPRRKTPRRKNPIRKNPNRPLRRKNRTP